VICGFAAAPLFDLTTLEGLEIGAIISATDGAAIFALLRASTLRRPIARTLEGESGFNDPVAVLLVIGFIDWIEQPDYGLVDMVLLFVREMGIGAVVGVAVGALAVNALRRTRLASAGLYPVATLSAAGLAFGGAATLHGSGFLAAYIAGLVLGSGRIPAKQTVTAFHEGLAWVAQIAMFLALGLLVFPSALDDVWLEGTVLTLILVFVARPVSVAIATAFEDFSARERIVIGWAGLRGAVPVVLATFPVIDRVPEAQDFFNIVFFAVVISTLLQGSTVEWLARKLGVTTNEPALPRPLVETGTVRRLGAEIVEYPVGQDDAIVGQLVRELGLPRDALLSVIVRGDEALLPRGSTRIEAADRLHVMVREEVAEEMEDLLERWRIGPVGVPPRRRPLLRSGSAVFSMRSWSEADGEAGYPREVDGVPVAEQIRTRRDQPGALVQLVDGRFACTGPQLALGGPLQLQRYARRRLGAEEDAAARAWWQEVIGALAR
jgi:cell volume regulation protein A